MGDSNELIEVGLTVLIALAVGLTSASFGRGPLGVESKDGPPLMRTLVDNVVRALVPMDEGTAEPK